MPAYKLSSGECTIGSFPLSSVKQKCKHTGSSHPTGECTLVVSLYQVRITNASVRADERSFPLPGPNWIVILLWVLPQLGGDTFNLSMGHTGT